MASLAHVHGVIALWELDAEARPWSFSWCEHGWVNQADRVETGTLTFFLYLKGTFELSDLCVKQVDCLETQNTAVIPS